MKIENIAINGFETAFRGMRNPKNSWNLSDSIFGIWDKYSQEDILIEMETLWKAAYPDYDTDWYEKFKKNMVLDSGEQADLIAAIGPKDMRLAQTLCNAGSEHRKFLRQINVSMDITAPLYWWKEADTYKVATVANSTSTMHKIASKPINDLSNFEIDDYNSDLHSFANPPFGNIINNFLAELENLRQCHLHYLEQAKQARTPEEKKKCESLAKIYWKELIRWLPEGWTQKRTWSANYETLRAIYGQRKNHKLTEWHTFCNVIEKLPYAEELILPL